MTFQSQSHASEDQHHSADLLPAYLNGTLDAVQYEHVRVHLMHCEACRAELETWETIQETAHFAVATTPLPSANVLHKAFASIDARQHNRLAWGRSFQHSVTLLWLIFKRQIPLLHKSIWIGSALVILFGCVLALYAILSPVNHLSFAVSFLALIMTVSSATGVAFIYGAENDAGLGIMLSTPTLIRIVMLCRLVLVVGFNLGLGAFASGILAVVHGGSPWQIIQLWLGPMLLLSSIALTFSLLLGSWFAVLIALVLESIQALPFYVAHRMPTLHLASPASWQTTPTILFLAVLFIVFAVLYAPRHPRLSN
jgi:hypothetical protein